MNEVNLNEVNLTKWTKLSDTERQYPYSIMVSRRFGRHVWVTKLTINESIQHYALVKDTSNYQLMRCVPKDFEGQSIWVIENTNIFMEELTEEEAKLCWDNLENYLLERLL